MGFGFWVLGVGVWVLGLWFWGLGFWCLVLVFGLWRFGGFWVLGFGFWVLGFGFWVLGLEFWFLGFRFRIWGFGFWVLEFGFWVWGFSFGSWKLGFTWYRMPRSRRKSSTPGSRVWGLGCRGLGVRVWGVRPVAPDSGEVQYKSRELKPAIRSHSESWREVTHACDVGDWVWGLGVRVEG